MRHDFIQKQISSPSNKLKAECEINGKRIIYNGCSSKSLKDAKEYYTDDKWEYIGSGNIMYFGNVKNVYNKVHHFFKFK